MTAPHPPLTALVPHRASMLLVDRVLVDEPLRVRVEATIRRGQLFSTDAGLPAWVGVELMAQAVAAWAGLRARERGEPVPMGFLLGTRRYACAVSHFPPGARLEVEAEQELAAANGMVVFACRVEREGEVLATANLNIYQPEDVAGYLEGARHG